MVFKHFNKDVINPQETFEYYYATSSTIYDDIDAVSFLTKEDAIKYITSNEHYPEYTLNIIRLYRDDNGFLYEKVDELCRIPTQKKKTASYYILGTKDGDTIKQLMCFPYWFNEKTDLGLHSFKIFERTYGVDNVEIYKVMVNLTDDNRLEYQYEAVSIVKENGEHKLVK